MISVFQTSGVVLTRPEGVLVGKDFLCSLRNSSACVHSCIAVRIFGLLSYFVIFLPCFCIIFCHLQLIFV